MTTILAPGRFRAYLFLLVAAAVLFAGHPAWGANLSFSAPSNVTANPGTIGNSFDVSLTNTGASPVTIQGFSFEIATVTPNITFTGAFTNTSGPYIFGSNSFFGVGNPPEIDTNTGQTLDASDVDSTFSGVSVGANQTVGLGHILFNVAPGTPAGAYSVTFSGPATSLSDPNGITLSNTTENGTITVSGLQATPEPSTLVLCLLGGGPLLIAAWRGRRRLYPGRPQPVD